MRKLFELHEEKKSFVMDIIKLGRYSDLVFKSEEHHYFIDDIELSSVSKMISGYKPIFDSQSISEKVSAKLKIPQWAVLELWDIKKNHQSSLGSEFHLYVEMFLNHNVFVDYQTCIKSKIQAFHDFYDKNKEKYVVVGCEIKIYDKEWRIAGTIDCLVMNIKTGKYQIWDWKTNSAIKFENKWQSMKGILSSLPDCNYYHYSLQLQIYQEILKKHFSIQFSDNYLVYFPESGYKPIKCENMQEQALLMLEENKTLFKKLLK